MKRVLVSQRTMREERFGEMRDALDQRWHGFLAACNLLPILIPNHAALAIAIAENTEAAGFLITGGNDSPEREAAENAVLAYALKKHLPVMGVCHGMQVIQRHFGVTVAPVPGHVSPSMEILIEGKPAVVNSYHDLGARGTVPELSVWAAAKDGVVKAVRHTSRPVLGIMWHPERNAPYAEADINRTAYFFGVKS